MNCKINRTHNKLANVFGPEFDKSPEEIVNIIRKISKLELIGPGYNPIEVEVALYNNDYYIRPGDARNHFIKEFQKIFSESKNLEKVMDQKMAYIGTTIRLSCLIKKYFDEDYFEEQIARRNQPIKPNVNKEKLRKFLKKLNKENFELFFSVVIEGRLEYGLFITDVSSANLWKKIRESCRAAGANVPEDIHIEELNEFMENNRTYYFNILSSKVLANLLCDAIDLDVNIATSAAQKLYNSGRSAMIEYIKREVKEKISA